MAKRTAILCHPLVDRLIHRNDARMADHEEVQCSCSPAAHSAVWHSGP